MVKLLFLLFSRFQTELVGIVDEHMQMLLRNFGLHTSTVVYPVEDNRIDRQQVYLKWISASSVYIMPSWNRSAWRRRWSEDVT